MGRSVLCGLLLSAALQPAATETPAASPPPLAATLVLPSNAPELTAMPELRGRLEKSPHDYLRGTNALFQRLLCERYGPALGTLPAVTLHGDAHIEQYSVTDRGRGLTDFDDSAVGSAFIDLVRFATSIRLAVEKRGWPGAEEMIRAFLDGYAKALRRPDTVAIEPAVVARIRRGFDPNRMAQLARAEALMTPLPPERQPRPEELDHVASVLGAASNGSSSFFRVKNIGALGIGIGSAADEKYLMRIEGPTAAPEDDLMLEMKEVRPLPGIPCVYGVRDAARVLLGQKVIAYEPFAVIGSLAAGDRHFWFHTWTDHYTELRIDRSFENPGELREVVYDAGVQLGRGHPRRLARGDAADLRKTLLRNLPKAPLTTVSSELAGAVREAWKAFKTKS